MRKNLIEPITRLVLRKTREQRCQVILTRTQYSSEEFSQHSSVSNILPASVRLTPEVEVINHATIHLESQALEFIPTCL